MTAPAFTEGHRGALLIGTGRYDHPQLGALHSPAADCAQLARLRSATCTPSISSPTTTAGCRSAFRG
ncbi:hypothetical protein ABT075_33945 [Streptomyces sp. NPDC002677]|uniref:hypothetical protein n=1 Tax=Streptomyces sp. NPDC002677 TaxID=3154774 RepID=UPI00332D3F2B